MTDLRNRMRLALLVLVSTMLWHCREKPVADKVVLKEEIVEKTNPKVIIDLCAFADISVTDTTDIDPLLRFKMIDSTGAIQEIDTEEAARLFKKLKSGKKVSSLPMMEFKETNNTLVIIHGRGYGGPIWATLIFDNETLRIETVVIEQRAESEGYGSGITMSSFENQFTGVEMKNVINLFGLKKGNQTFIEGEHKVDGISGATVTCQSVVNIFNQSVQKLAGAMNVQ